MRSRQHKAAMRRLMIKSLLCMLLLPGASAVWSDGGILLWPPGVIFSPMVGLTSTRGASCAGKGPLIAWHAAEAQWATVGHSFEDRFVLN